MRARIEQLRDDEQTDEARWQALALALVDAILVADADAVDEAFDGLGLLTAQDDDEREPHERSWAQALQSVAYWALERMPSSDGCLIQPDTRVGGFLAALVEQSPQTSTQLRLWLDTDEAQISRAGRELLAAGLVIQRRAGRHAYWEPTPRGRQALAAAPARDDAVQPRTRADAKTAGARYLRQTGHSGPQRELSVVPAAAGGWAVRKPGRRRPIATTATKREALAHAHNELGAEPGGGILSVHGRDGRLQRSTTVRGRPRRPR